MRPSMWLVGQEGEEADEEAGEYMRLLPVCDAGMLIFCSAYYSWARSSARSASSRSSAPSSRRAGERTKRTECRADHLFHHPLRNTTLRYVGADWARRLHDAMPFVVTLCDTIQCRTPCAHPSSRPQRLEFTLVAACGLSVHIRSVTGPGWAVGLVASTRFS